MNMKDEKLINQIREKINSLLNAFPYTNDYIEGRNKVLYELLDYLNELENTQQIQTQTPFHKVLAEKSKIGGAIADCGIKAANGKNEYYLSEITKVQPYDYQFDLHNHNQETLTFTFSKNGVFKGVKYYNAIDKTKENFGKNFHKFEQSPLIKDRQFIALATTLDWTYTTSLSNEQETIPNEIEASAEEGPIELD